MLAAGASVDRDFRTKHSSSIFRKPYRNGSLKNERISKLMMGKVVEVVDVPSDVEDSTFDEMRKAAIEDYLARFFDLQELDVPISLVSQLLATRVAVSSLENILQILWFGGDIKHKYLERSPLQVAGKYGTPATVRVLLEADAFVNEGEENGSTSLLAATRYGSHEVVKLLLEAKSNVNATTKKGVTPLLNAVKYGTGLMVDELLKHGANVSVGVSELKMVYSTANVNQKHHDDVVNVLDKHFHYV